MPSGGRGTRIDGPAAASRGTGRLPALLLTACLAAAAAACAREEPPPGTAIDNAPPRLLSTRPEDGAVVEDMDGPLRLRFDEPVDERPNLLRELRASPADRYRIDFGFSTVEIEPRGGWRDDAVYFFHIPPPFTDVVGNRTERAVEVVFSTGPPVTDTRVEGTVLDAVEGRPLRRARVLFYRRDGDSVPYTAVQDTGDVFALTALPPGRYRAYGFRDLNANRRLEARLEAHDSTTFELDGPDATVSLELRVVEPDSTPPVLASASARDSQLVELRFDDPLDPRQAFDRVEVSVRDTATGETWPVAAVGLTPGQVGRAAAAPGRRAAPPDTSPVPDAAPTDTAPAPGAPADTADRRTRDASPRAAAADTAPLPSRTALVRLGRALRDGAAYRVRVDGVRNLRRLAGGGDTVFVYPPAADTAGRADTARAAPDTAGAAPDTAAARRDTSPPGEAAPTPRDTVPPDTPPRDTAADGPHCRGGRRRPAGRWWP